MDCCGYKYLKGGNLPMKKIPVLILIICALLFGLYACAEGDGMDIRSADDFVSFMNALAENPQANAYLSNDIDLSDVELQPALALNGSLEGNGFALKNIRVEGGEGECALFLEIGGSGSVRNLTLSGLFSGNRAASLAVVNNGSVENVKNRAEIFITGTGAGLVCENRGSLTDCENSGNIYILNGGMGAGVCGVNHGSISGCVNRGEVFGTEMTPYAACAAGICAESRTGSLIENCANLGRISAGQKGAGIACRVTGAQLRGLNNFGDVFGIVEGVGGIASEAENSMIENCANYGEIASNTRYGAGILVEGGENAEVSFCRNYGEVSAETYAAGIICRAADDVRHCANYADISAYDYAAGICNILYNSIRDCSNSGEIICQSKYTAGIVCEAQSGTVERCVNSGHISGGKNQWGDSMANGGIVGAAYGESFIMDVCNTGFVEALYNDETGGIAWKIEGILTNAVNFSDTRTDVCVSDGAELRRVYGRYSSGLNFQEADKFFTGELAWLLDTNAGSQRRGVWAQTDDHPVIADEYHQPVRRYQSVSSFGESVVYTTGDGKVKSITATSARGTRFFDENGAEIDSEEIISDDGPFGSKREIEYVGDVWALREALSNRNAKEIVLTSSITLTSDVTLSKDIAFRGQGHRLILDGNSFICRGNAVVSDLSVAGENPVEVSGALKVEGFLAVDVPVDASRGKLDLSSGRIYNKNEIDGAASFTTRDAAEFPGYTAVDGAYYAYLPEKSMAIKKLVAPARLNKSIAYDIYLEIRNGIIYFFMPCTANLEKLTICAVNEDGEYTQTFKNLDLTEGNGLTLPVFGSEYPVQALQSDLPTLTFEIDESVVTIDAMNSSADHSVHCYGNVRLDVPAKLQKEKKWNTFVSTENDSSLPGTVSIRGRGNSTWSTKLDVKKPYQFKLEKKVDVLGMGKHKTWILLRNDARLVENKLGLDLAEDLGLAYTSMGEFVDLFMNGEYLGNYLLCERVEISKERVNIAKLDTEFENNRYSTYGLDLTGGYLMEIDRAGEELQIIHSSGNTITIKEPEDLDISVTENGPYSYINAYMLDFLDAIFGDGFMNDGRSYLEYIDAESFARYFFHQEFLMNLDCGRGSTFLYKDRDSIDPLIYAGPVWDHDRIFEGGQDNYSGWHLSTITRDGTENVTFYNQLNRRRDFVELLIHYYENSDISQVLKNAGSHIASYSEMLQESAKMNSLRWWLPDFDIDWMAETMNKRAAWIDANYKTLMDIAQ